MPNVIRFNSKATDKYEALAALFGKSSAEDFAQEVSDLRASTGVAGSLKEYGIDEKEWEEKLDTLTENAMKDPCTLFNPRKPEFAEIKANFQACHDGTAINF
nr:iron-containing alcohol dehydrogenase [Desulfotalea psychrophila]